MKLNPNSLFLVAVILGLLGAGLSLLPLSSARYLGLGISIVVLVAYHRYAYLATIFDERRRLPDGRVVSQSALADSCYYLGFIFTLFILFSAFIHNINPDPGGSAPAIALTPILTQFSLGLFTTGYGLSARIHLSMLTETEEADPDALRQRLTLRTLGLIAVIEGGITQISSALASANDSISMTAQRADNQLAEKANNLNQLIEALTKKLREQLSLVSFDAEIAGVKAGLGGLAKELTFANKTTADTAHSIAESTEVQAEMVQHSLEVLQKLAEGADATRTSIDLLNRDYTSLANTISIYNDRLELSSASSVALSSSTEKLSESFETVATSASKLEPVLGELGSAGEMLSVESRDLATEIELLSKRIKEIERYVGNQIPVDREGIRGNGEG